MCWANMWHGSWCHLCSICVASHGWKVPFSAYLQFSGWRQVYLPFLFRQLQPVCPGRKLLWYPYQCLWQKAVENNVFALLQPPVTSLYVLLLWFCTSEKMGRRQGPFSLHHCWHSDIKRSFMPPLEWELSYQFVSVMFPMFIHESSSSCYSLSSHRLGKNADRSSSLCTFPPLLDGA